MRFEQKATVVLLDMLTRRSNKLGLKPKPEQIVAAVHRRFAVLQRESDAIKARAQGRPEDLPGQDQAPGRQG